MRTHITLNKKEKEMFTAEFYRLWDLEIHHEKDLKNSSPWGCPWLYPRYSQKFLEGLQLLSEDVEEAARLWFYKCKKEILYPKKKHDLQGELWQPCERCGKAPIYMSLGHLCEDCGF